MTWPCSVVSSGALSFLFICYYSRCEPCHVACRIPSILCFGPPMQSSSFNRPESVGSLSYNSKTLMPSQRTSDANHIAEDALKFYSLIAASVDTPLCLVDQKGFVHFTNDAFRELVDVPISFHFPFIGRFLETSSSVQLRNILFELSESERRQTVFFSAVFSANVVKDSARVQRYSWSIAGHKKTPVFVISGR